MNELMKFTRETTLELAKIQREKLIQQAINFVGRLSGEAFLEIENSKIEENKSNGDLEAVVTKILAVKLNNLLKDVDWRIKTAAEQADKVPAEGLNLKSHLLTGFTITDDSPAAGSIAWAGCHIVYQGTDVTITDGDSALKYIWWDYDAEPNTVFQESATKPTLTDDDVLVFVNEDGTHHTIMSKMPPGAFLLGTSISALELGTDSVTTAKIKDAAVEAAKLGAGSVTHVKMAADAIEADNIKDGEVGSAEIAALAILEGKLAAGAVTVNKIGDLAVTSGKLGAGAVVVGKLGDLAVETGKINDLAVLEGKLGAGAVTHGKLGADSVEADNIKDGEVNTAELAASAVTNAKIGDGVIATSKLNLLSHMLY